MAGLSIVSKEGLLIAPIPDRVQRWILNAMLRPAMAGQFVGLIIPQARKMGVSTQEPDSVGSTERVQPAHPSARSTPTGCAGSHTAA